MQQHDNLASDRECWVEETQETQVVGRLYANHGSDGTKNLKRQLVRLPRYVPQR